MRTLFCAALFGLGTLVVIFFQKAKLETLQQEAHTLEASVRERAADPALLMREGRSRRDQAAGVASKEMVNQLKPMVNLASELYLKTGRDAAYHQEWLNTRNKMIPELVNIDHRSAFNLLNQSLELFGITKEERDLLVEGYVGTYTDSNPLEALKLFELLPDYPDFTKQLITAYPQAALVSPGHAVAWFEEQSRNGNPIAGNPEIIRTSLTAQSRADPARAVARMAALPDSEATKGLGNLLVREFRNVAEHLAFAGALENEFAQNPTSSSLEEIRKRYVRTLVLTDWPFEEAVLLIEGCSTPEDKMLVARNSSLANGEDAGRWADWVASLEVADIKDHPLPTYIGYWTGNDPAAAMNWLKNNTSGSLRERSVVSLAYSMAMKDPRNGLSLLSTLPESKERSNTIQRVRERWRKADPAAEAEFNEAAEMMEGP